MTFKGDAEIAAVDRDTAADLLPLVYAELRDLARARLAREAPGQTLTATALVHEVFIRLADAGQVDWHDRTHFFAIAARSMRRARNRCPDSGAAGFPTPTGTTAPAIR